MSVGLTLYDIRTSAIKFAMKFNDDAEGTIKSASLIEKFLVNGDVPEPSPEEVASLEVDEAIDALIDAFDKELALRGAHRTREVLLDQVKALLQLGDNQK